MTAGEIGCELDIDRQERVDLLLKHLDESQYVEKKCYPDSFLITQPGGMIVRAERMQHQEARLSISDPCSNISLSPPLGLHTIHSV